MLHCLPRREFEFSKNVKEHGSCPIYMEEGKRRGFDLCPDSTLLLCFYFEVSLSPRGPVCKFYKRYASKVSMCDSYMRSHTANNLGLHLPCRLLRGQQGTLSHSTKEKSKQVWELQVPQVPASIWLKGTEGQQQGTASFISIKPHGLSRGLWEQ